MKPREGGATFKPSVFGEGVTSLLSYEMEVWARLFFITMSLDDSKFVYVHQCKTAKKMWGNIEMIYGVSPISNKIRWTHE